MIPRIIHYCWFGPKKMSKTDINCIKSWKKYLPNYEYKLWNEENSPMDSEFVKKAYQAKKYAFVADYVRIWALKNFGGIYMDTDMLVLKKFDELLDNESFVCGEQVGKISAGIIGCKKNDVFMTKSLEFYETLNFSLENIENISIPIIITTIFNKLSEIEKPRVYDVDYFYSLPFEATIEGDFNYKKYLTKNSYAVHLWNASWLEELNEYRKKNQKFFHRIYMRLCNFKNIVLNFFKK